MKINKKVELGVLVVKTLRNKEGYSGTTTLATEIGTTPDFLYQVMRSLTKAGVVNVKRGPGGGYFLNKDANVSVYDIAEAVGSNFTMVLPESPLFTLSQNLKDAFVNTSV